MSQSIGREDIQEGTRFRVSIGDPVPKETTASNGTKIHYYFWQYDITIHTEYVDEKGVKRETSAPVTKIQTGPVISNRGHVEDVQGDYITLNCRAVPNKDIPTSFKFDQEKHDERLIFIFKSIKEALIEGFVKKAMEGKIPGVKVEKEKHARKEVTKMLKDQLYRGEEDAYVIIASYNDTIKKSKRKKNIYCSRKPVMVDGKKTFVTRSIKKQRLCNKTVALSAVISPGGVTQTDSKFRPKLYLNGADVYAVSDILPDKNQEKDMNDMWDGGYVQDMDDEMFADGSEEEDINIDVGK